MPKNKNKDKRNPETESESHESELDPKTESESHESELDGWTVDDRKADWKGQLNQTEENKYETFISKIRDDKLHPRQAGQSGDYDYKELMKRGNLLQIQIRLSKNNRATFALDAAERVVKVLQVGGHT